MAFVCTNCTAPLEYNRIVCRRCGYATVVDASALGTITKAKIVSLDCIDAVSVERIVTGGPWDEMWGGGIVPSSVSLVGGTPGCGKTTMLMQIASAFARITGKRSYFMSAEQSPGEIRLMANRLGITNTDRINVLSAMGGGSDLSDEMLRDDPPGMFVTDSISAMCGKDKRAELQIAKKQKLTSTKYTAPSFLVCHITKDEGYAGLMALQHEVDTLIAVTHPTSREADKLLRERRVADEEALNRVRVLAAIKNRYGATAKDYFLEITDKGLCALPSKPGETGISVDDDIDGESSPVPRKTGVPLADTVLERQSLEEELRETQKDLRERIEELREREAELAAKAERSSKQPAKTTKSAVKATEPASEPPQRIGGPTTIEINGQKLVRRVKKGGRPARATAVEGEALKHKRPAVPKTKAAKRVTAMRHAKAQREART